MSDRVCIRGCTRTGEHYATCVDYGREDGACKGCAPVPARDRALICNRCYHRLRRHIEDAPDIIGHLRTIADPIKAAVYDKILVSSSHTDLPAPVAADIIDASNDITATLRAWALHIQFGVGHPWHAAGLEAGIDAADAYQDARGCVDLILDNLDRLVNDSHQIIQLCDGIIHRHPDHEPPPYWTVADALGKWPLEDRAHWAPEPCPECDLKTVRVTPPRQHGALTRYWCTVCDWETDDQNDRRPATRAAGLVTTGTK